MSQLITETRPAEAGQVTSPVWKYNTPFPTIRRRQARCRDYAKAKLGEKYGEATRPCWFKFALIPLPRFDKFATNLAGTGKLNHLSRPVIPNIYSRFFKVRSMCLSASRFWSVWRLSNFFLPRATAISILILPFLLYTESGMIVKPRWCSTPANSPISFLVSTSFAWLTLVIICIIYKNCIISIICFTYI